MVWIANDRAQRAREEFGAFHAHDWRSFLIVIDIDLIETDLPASLPAFVYNDTIVIRRGLHPLLAAWWAWHEVGHLMLHAGDRRFWRARPQGEITLAKFERQADEFAATFPIWDEQAALFWPN